MNKINKIKRKEILVLLFFSLSVFITLIYTDFLESVDNLILNSHLNNTIIKPQDEKIILVLGSDKSIKELNGWPFKRSIHAEMIADKLVKAKTIAFDIILFDESNEKDDKKLEDAIKKHGNVVLGSSKNLTDGEFTNPLERFEKNASEIGYFNFFTDSDKITRKYKMFIEEKQDNFTNIVPSFIFACLSAHGYNLNLNLDTKEVLFSKDNQNLKTISLDKNYSFWNTRIENQEIYEYSDVYYNRIPKETFEDAIVFVGISGTGASDVVHTSQDSFAGTRVLANLTNTFLSGFNPKEISNFIEAVIIFILFIALGILVFEMPIRFSFIVPVISIILTSLISRLLFIENILYIHTFKIGFFIVLSYVVSILSQLWIISKEYRMTSIPILQISNLEENIRQANSMDLERYLLSLRPIIEHETGMMLLEPILKEDDSIFKNNPEILETLISQHGFIFIKNFSSEKPRHRIFITHTKMEKQKEFTLLAANSQISETTIQSIAALIITSSLYFKAMGESIEKQRVFYTLVQCMISAIDAKDPITSGHSARVAKLSVEIGESLGMSRKELEEIEFAANIHDIGKIGIDDHILNKAGIFSSEEYKIMQQHTQKGLFIMRSVSLSRNVVDGILNHHERIDGKGYPRKVKGKDIGLFAKVIKISDVYDALISTRQYKKSWPLEKVCDTLYRGRGTEFDEKILDLFLEKIKPDNWVPPKDNDNDINDNINYLDIIEFAKKLIYRSYSFLMDYKKFLPSDDTNYSFGNYNFYDMEWGESLSSHKFLIKRPFLIGYDKNERYYYALKNKNIVVYCFLRGFLTESIIYFEKDFRPDSILKDLGKASYENKEYAVWENNKLYVVLLKNKCISYITKYSYGEGG